MTVFDILTDLTFASILILFGQFLRAKVSLFQRFFMPASMIAGILGFILGKQVLDILPFSSAIGSYTYVLIILIFTIVGVNGFESSKGVSAGEVFKRVASYQLFRFVAYFIQFAIPIAVTLTLLKWLVPDINPGIGIMLAAGFTGGHGTAAAVGKTFVDMGWADATDIGMTFATVGILVGIFGGLAFIKWATRKGYTAYIKDFSFISGDLKTGLIQKENQKSIGNETISSVSLDTLGFHMAIVVAISGIAYLLNTKILSVYVVKGIPFFTISFILGMAFFMIFRKKKVYDYIDTRINLRISGAATDLLVFFGISSIKISVIIAYALPMLVLAICGFICIYITMLPLGYLMNRDSWFERSLFCYGYCTGVFAIGFVLLRIVDPENKSRTIDDTAMSPFIGFIEILMWTLIPAALVSGQGWIVVGILSAAIAVCLATAVFGKMWYTQPLSERKGIDVDD